MRAAIGAGMAASCAFVLAVMAGYVYAQENLTLWASEDAWVNEQNPDVSYGSNTYVSLKDRSGSSEAWLRFSAADLEQARAANIAEASLWMYQYMGTYSPGDELNLHLADTSWNEQSITWSGKPTYAADGISSISVQEGEGVWREWKGLGGLLKTWTGGDLCIALENHLDGKNEEFFGRFYSSEYSVPEFRPQIKVTTTPEPVSALLFLGGVGVLAAAKRRGMTK